MRVIELDGEGWKTPLEFLQALYDGIEQGCPHGLSIDAFVDSMIWRGMGGIEPPYAVRVANVSDAPEAVVNELIALCSAIRAARLDRRARDGVDVDVSISCPELAI